MYEGTPYFRHAMPGLRGTHSVVQNRVLCVARHQIIIASVTAAVGHRCFAVAMLGLMVNIRTPILKVQPRVTGASLGPMAMSAVNIKISFCQIHEFGTGFSRQ